MLISIVGEKMKDFKTFLVETRYYEPRLNNDIIRKHHEEQTYYDLNSDWEEGDGYREILKGSADIFREFTKPEPDWKFIKQKENDIKQQIQREKENGHALLDYSFEHATKHNLKHFSRLYNIWTRHLYNNEAQKIIIDLNVALLKGNWDDAEKNLKLMLRLNK
jgi:hypothetical protein